MLLSDVKRELQLFRAKLQYIGRGLGFLGHRYRVLTASFDRNDLLPNPIDQFKKWFDEAKSAQVIEANAMTLATANKDGCPSSRTVLLKGVDERGFIFFTNYESRKSRELAENPRLTLNFYWRELERQVCICGTATKVSREESEAYFKTRPLGSRIGAWASKQDAVLSDRHELEKKVADAKKKYPGEDVPLPPYWGGFVVAPTTVEFWQGRPSRLHDRFFYTKQADGSWKIDRLSP
jgi:pyridoxamine 5'-phosphate oxidase